MNELLIAWMKMSIWIKGNRLLENFSFNEMLICNYIAQNKDVTAKDLCENTQLLKSQMNRILTAMETKGIIYKEKCATDKRKTYIQFTKKGFEVYLKEHEYVLSIVNKITDSLGPESTQNLASLMSKAIDALKGE